MNIRNTLCAPCEKAPQKAIAYAWFTSIILVAISFIIVCTVAASAGGKDGSHTLAFAGVWTVLVLIAVSAGGIMVMRKYRTSLAVGFFLGVVAVLSQQMFILFAIFAGRADTEDDDDVVPADQAFSAFSFFLFLVYAVFAAMLAVFRVDIIDDDSEKYNEDDIPAASVPPTGV